jgi:hypothetical protein
VCSFVFPFFSSLLSISYQPSILNITSVILQARKYLTTHSTGTKTTPRTMTGKQKKQGKVSPQQKISTGTRGE